MPDWLTEEQGHQDIERHAMAIKIYQCKTDPEGILRLHLLSKNAISNKDQGDLLTKDFVSGAVFLAALVAFHIGCSRAINPAE